MAGMSIRSPRAFDYEQANSSSDESEREDHADEGDTVSAAVTETDTLDELIITDRKESRGPRACCSARNCCHVCYVVQFFAYVVAFPLWAKWLVMSPMPEEFWGQDFPPFPRLAALFQNSELVRGDVLAPGHEILMSPVPTSPGSCNFSCGATMGQPSGSLMNFQVHLTLNDSYLPKVKANTIYPVVMASADFQEWWVVADRRHAAPHTFWESRTFNEGQVYTHTTDECTIPPGEGQSYTSSAIYVVACVTWNLRSLNELTTIFQDMEDDPHYGLSTQELAGKCDAIGGVCGWPCGSSLHSERLAGCSEEGIVQVTEHTLAGAQAKGAHFAGTVELLACEEGSKGENAHEDSCVTAEQPMQKWPCHHCWAESQKQAQQRRLAPFEFPTLIPPAKPLPGTIWDDEGATDEDTSEDSSEEEMQGGYIYSSLPKFAVKLKGVKIKEGFEVLSMPRAFIFHSAPGGPSAPPNNWQKLYGMYKDSMPPQSVRPGADRKPVVKDDEKKGQPPVINEETKHAMHLEQENRLSLHSDWCFSPRGPLYLVACGVNQSMYDQNEGFQFEAGQRVAPPPFNDRCLALSGRCAHACMNDQSSEDMAYCDKHGYINMTKLVGTIRPLHNNTLPVWLFVYTLLIGFAVKVVTLCPGIFKPYSFKHGYEPELTEQLRYIVTCTCSSGENKCTVLRNLIGVIACMPRDCKCRYHVAYADEGHRADHKAMWQRLVGLIASVPDFGGSSYEENLMQFMQMWTDETKKLALSQLDDSGKKVVDQSIMDRLSGKTVIKKLRREVGWYCSRDDEEAFKAMEDAIVLLEAALREKRSVKINVHRDDCADWAPADEASLPLRLHYLARARPVEDERSVPAQHVAPGVWYYKMPPDASLEDWLRLRSQAREYVYGIDGQAEMDFNVPLRTSRGKAGGLNFCENYLAVCAERPENLYGSVQDEAPCLFSICDARHQFQQDFFHATLPYFFDEDGELNVDVAFTQCPQYFHEMQDKLDYLDNNNAAFFRLNCMIRNCCGGVSSCGTNGTWMIKHRDTSTVWETERKRVRDSDKARRVQVVERRVFSESCKVEDTASSLQAVLYGRRSQFINRRLSYGMAKDPENYLAAVQRWAEGGVVLSLQTFLGLDKGVYMVWGVFAFFLFFVISMMRLVSPRETWLVSEMSLMGKDAVDGYVEAAISALVDFCMAHAGEYWRIRPQRVRDYVSMSFQCAMWLLGLLLVMVVVWLATLIAKAFRRKRCLFPDEMRWWARLLVSMDNLTYFFWFWTSFFWVGFNYYNVFAQKDYHFQAEGMFIFMLIVNALHWGMTVSAALRYQLEESMESNEVIFLTLDNVWRSTQLFYITAPLLLYSIIEGVRDYLRYQFYGEDISFWVGGDRGRMSKELVKYWTLVLIIGDLVAWTYYFAFGGRHEQGSLAACLIVTIIALDVLHPCVYLWVGNSKMTREEAYKMSWTEALCSRRWWSRRLYSFVLNPVMTGFLRWSNPLWQLSMPIACIWLPYLGINQGFYTLGTNTMR